jgi:hypothetical protein
MGERLTPTEIARRIGMNKSALVRYLTIPENRVLFGAAQKPPTYPIEKLPMFEGLRVLHEQGAVTPQTFAGSWKMVNPSDETRPILSMSLGAELGRAGPDGDGAYDDKLLTAAEAAVYLACDPGEVSQFVPAKYALSDIHAYIRALRAKAGG